MVVIERKREIMEKPIVKVKNVIIRGDYLYGTVINHPRFKEDTRVQTSTIIKQYSENDKNFVETMNTIYELI